MTMLFAAVHESVVGTKRTWRDVRLESAMRCKADVEKHSFELLNSWPLVVILAALLIIG
jgi:hypothetical protein